MARIKWDQAGDRIYQTGDKNGVMYPQKIDGTYDRGAGWNGLTAVTESPSGAEPTDLYADDMKYLSIRSKETFGFTIQCYDYPDEFDQCNGYAEIATGVRIGQQARHAFGFSYTSILGNDTMGDDYGFIIHLFYNATASPSERSHATVNDSPDAIEFSYECTTLPVDVDGFRPTSTIEIDSTAFQSTAEKALLNAFLDVIWGADGGDTYSAATITGGKFEPGLIYYERTGTEGSYVYTETSATTPVDGTTYYTNGSRYPYLPLPKEVATLLTAS